MTKQLLRHLFYLPLLLITLLAKGQSPSVELFGPTVVKKGQASFYSVLMRNNPGNIDPTYCWSVVGGTFRIVNDGCKDLDIPMGTCEKCVTIEVTWGDGSVPAYVWVNTNDGVSTLLNVKVVTAIKLPDITPASQQVKYNTAATAFTQPAPSGGNGMFTYQWQKQNNDLNWENISGATASTYTPPVLVQNTHYRVSVFSVDTAVFSKPVEVVVRKVLHPGEIFGFQQVPANIQPGIIRGESASGEEGRFTYQWQESADKSTWTNITAANGVYYTPKPLSSTRYYRRKATSLYGTVSTDVYSNISTVLIAGTGAGNVPSSGASGYTQPLRQQADPGDAVTSYNTSNIKEWNVMKPGVKATTGITSLGTAEVFSQQRWYDGLGRPLQTINNKSTTRSKDIIQHYSYDELGRSKDMFLPYVDSLKQGTFRKDAGTVQQQFYKSNYPTENFFFNHSVLDASGRESMRTGVGNSWSGTNAGEQSTSHIAAADEKIYRWILVNDTTPALPGDGTRFYDPNEIVVNEMKDIYGRVSIAYYDRQGRVVMEKIQQNDAGNNWIYSYTVFDDFNRARYAITPKAAKWIADNKVSIPANSVWAIPYTIKHNLCFGYQYDEKGRLYARKEPGVGEILVVYDKRYRPLLTQSPLQKSKGQWEYNIYDRKSRVVISGIYTNAIPREQLQNQVDVAAIGEGSISTINQPAPVDLQVSRYDGSQKVVAKNSITFTEGYVTPDGVVLESYPDPALQDISIISQVLTDQDYLGLINNTNCQPQRINYYDDYSFAGATAKPFNTTYTSKLKGGVNVMPAERSGFTEGLLTGTKIKVMYPEGVSGPEWLNTVVYYNDRGQILQTNADNILGGVDVASVQYDFAKTVLSSHLYHSNPWGKPMKSIEITKRFLYYDNGLPKQTWMSVDNATEKLLETNYYNDLGRLEKRVLGDGIETLDYSYNIRGWITGINKAYAENKTGRHFFGESIGYNEGFTNKQVDGQVSGIVWRRAGAPDAAMAYGFQYDAANRLQQAYFTQNTGTGPTGWSQSDKNYTVDNLAYDENGNILSMRSQASYLGTTKAVDDLTYTYEANSDRLSKVTDAAGDNKQNDFKQGNTGPGADYSYELNGALKTDANKKLALNWNSYLDKPDKLIFENDANKAIRYVYDASGNRLQKIIKEGNTSTSYTYIGNFIYKNDTTMVQFAHEAGRMRGVKQSLSGAYSLVLDYYIVDRLGNIRTVITEEKDTALYKATFETSRDAVEEATFSNRTSTRENIPTTYPFYNASTNKFWSRLNSTDPSKRIGASIVLKVMAGDTINVGTKAYYRQTGSSSSGTPVNDMVNALVNTLLGPAATVIDNGHGNLMQGNDRVLNTAGFSSFINNQQQQNNTPSANPKAYLNYVLFDEDFKMVSGNVIRINKSPDALQEYTGYLEVPQNGFLYAYISNESPVDVWFDDITIMHLSGRLLQENTLYPYGLEIASQSSRALMKAVNEAVFQGKELDEELGLNLNYFDARYYDPQLGRFISMDPLMQLASGYAGMGGNPVMFVDPDGRAAWFLIPIIIGALWNVYDNYDAISKAFAVDPLKGVGKLAGFAGVGALSGAAAYFIKNPYVASSVSSAITAAGNGILNGKAASKILDETASGALTGLVSTGVSTVFGKGIKKASGIAIDKITSSGVGRFGEKFGIKIGNVGKEVIGDGMKSFLGNFAGGLVVGLGDELGSDDGLTLEGLGTVLSKSAFNGLGVALVDAGSSWVKLKVDTKPDTRTTSDPSTSSVDIDMVRTVQNQTQVPVPSITPPSPIALPAIQPPAVLKNQQMINRLKALPAPTLKKAPLQ